MLCITENMLTLAQVKSNQLRGVYGSDLLQLLIRYMRICITRTHRNPYSVTFIRNQIEQLSTLADVVTLHTGRLPEKMENGSFLSPFPFWILHKVLKVLTGSPNNYFGHYGIKK